MTTLLYTEYPLNPLSIVRHRPDAGLAFEKYCWRLPNQYNHQIAPFSFGYLPMREFYKIARRLHGEITSAIPLTETVPTDALPQPDLHFTLVVEPQAGPPEILRTLVARWPNPLHLVFSQSLLSPFNVLPRDTKSLVEEIIGGPWEGECYPGWVPLLSEPARLRALDALGFKQYHRLYLVAGEAIPSALPPETLALFEQACGLTNFEQPRVEYRLFHNLVSHCDWLLTSHGNVPGEVPYCFYSLGDLKAEIQQGCPNPSERAVEIDDLQLLNSRAGVELKSNGGLRVSQIMPLEMLAGRSELSLAWSHLTQLDELPSLKAVKHLNLDATVPDDLSPLAEMEQLESLSVRYLKLDDLQPLTQLPSLRHLALSRVPVAGLSPLAAMPALRELNLDGMPLEDLSPVVACPQLETLSLNKTGLKRLDGIGKFASLERLELSRTSVTEVGPLSALRNLRELRIDDCQLESLAPLVELGELTTLCLSGDWIELTLPDLSPLAAMPKLKHLKFYNTIFQEFPQGGLVKTLETLDLAESLGVSGELTFKESTLARVANLEVLRELEIDRFADVDLSVLSGLNRLEALSARECTVGDLAWLKPLVRLRKLCLGWTTIADFQPLTDLPALESLFLDGVDFELTRYPVDVLSALSKLKELDLSRWRLETPAWLGCFKQLRRLRLRRTDLSDSTALGEMTEMLDLDLSCNPLRSIEGLRGLRKLRRLNLQETQIENLNALEQATELEELILCRTPVKDLTGLAGSRNLKKVDLSLIETSPDLSPLVELPRIDLLYLEHCGNIDVFDALAQRHYVVVRET